MNHPPTYLDRCQEELKKAEASGTPRGLWHLVKAVGMLVAYLRTRESQ